MRGGIWYLASDVALDVCPPRFLLLLAGLYMSGHEATYDRLAGDSFGLQVLDLLQQRPDLGILAESLGDFF